MSRNAWNSLDSLSTAYNARDSVMVRRVLRRILTSISANAVWHPLGFFRIELGSDALHQHYMLHCWPSGDLRRTQSPAWLLHCHAWNLESLVLEGELRDSQYKKDVLAPDSRTGILYLAHGTRPVSVLQRTTETAILSPSTESEVSPGSFYSVGMDHFHQTFVPATEFGISLARTSRQARQQAKVLGDEDGPELLHYRVSPVERSLVFDYLRRI